jgi:hypothetical protein
MYEGEMILSPLARRHRRASILTVCLLGSMGAAGLPHSTCPPFTFSLFREAGIPIVMAKE